MGVYRGICPCDHHHTWAAGGLHRPPSPLPRPQPQLQQPQVAFWDWRTLCVCQTAQEWDNTARVPPSRASLAQHRGFEAHPAGGLYRWWSLSCCQALSAAWTDEPHFLSSPLSFWSTFSIWLTGETLLLCLLLWFLSSLISSCRARAQAGSPSHACHTGSPALPSIGPSNAPFQLCCMVFPPRFTASARPPPRNPCCNKWPHMVWLMWCVILLQF